MIASIRHVASHFATKNAAFSWPGLMDYASNLADHTSNLPTASSTLYGNFVTDLQDDDDDNIEPIASDNLNLAITPMGLPCTDPSIKGWNNDNDFAYLCGTQGTIIAYWGCSCSHCCTIDDEEVTYCPSQSER
ncbi:hypothetical protein BDR04DRAFT_1119194 [Suillus decipiens]|nr:hypothetical protein BDR04DRAFT_1119194 [Suillus decipiens]